MNNVPTQLKKKWGTETAEGLKRSCMRTDDLENCDGRLTKEHALYYAGKELQKEYAILDLCAYHHSVDQFQDGPGLNKEKNIWIALNRADDDELEAISKAKDYARLRTWYNLKFGIWLPPKIK